MGGNPGFGGGGGNNNFGDSGTKNQGGDFGGQRRKNRVFAPVTMKMIQEASPRPDDVCEIEGEAINDVSDFSIARCFQRVRENYLFFDAKI